MHGIYKIEQMLCDELEELGKADELTAGSLETIDKLSHALKNVQKVIEYYEEMGSSSNASYGNENYGNGSYRGGSYRNSRYNNGSYARGRRPRDSRGRYTGYSRAEDMTAELRDLMNNTQDPQMRMRIEELMNEMQMG